MSCFGPGSCENEIADVPASSNMDKNTRCAIPRMYIFASDGLSKYLDSEVILGAQRFETARANLVDRVFLLRGGGGVS